ncbi:MAG: hypothetical protein HUJ31_09760, partial [Pseudomonadales bacterium]|nr:hypothetical protein [Pseudomonadales bacterium]
KGNQPINEVGSERPAELAQWNIKLTDDNRVICETCHRPHGAQGQPLLVVENDQSKLCRACHQDERSLIDTRHNLATTAPASRNLTGANPAESGPCSACHIPHNARGPKLWARSTDPSAGFASAACTGCHSSSGLSEKKLAGHNHPVGVALDKLDVRTGTDGWVIAGDQAPSSGNFQPLPLYDEQGNEVANDGEIACFTCHDVHRWQPGAQTVVDDGEGDGSNSFLRIRSDGESPLCTNCHWQQQSVVDTRHDTTRTAPESLNSQAHTPARSGVCGACHLPHNGQAEALWAREYPAEATGMERQCFGCHKQDGPAGKHLTGQFTHPIHVTPEVSNGMALPLYASASGDERQIDCGTCHDVHRWSASGVESDPDGEGDARNSFLRIPASDDSQLCIQCHKTQSLVIGTDHDLRMSAPGHVNGSGQQHMNSGT